MQEMLLCFVLFRLHYEFLVDLCDPFTPEQSQSSLNTSLKKTASFQKEAMRTQVAL